jgi:riboflavin kinase/FMN adenylyltransferase
MNILKSIGELSTLKGPIVLAAGTFDGVHLGHQSLIRRAMQEASVSGGTAVVMTFDRHPSSLLRPEKAPKLLTRNDEKISLFDGMGVPALMMLEFSEELAAISARDFMNALVTASSPLNAVCVGRQWSFGRGGVGNVALLKELGAEWKFEVIQIDPVVAHDSPISSTRIRAAIASGKLVEAESCLGRPFILAGTIVSGAGLGSKIGFPTANIDVLGMQLPPNGVYAVKIHCGREILNGVCNIGLRPTIDDSATKPVVEVHLFDFATDLVGQQLSLKFVKFLREERRFSGIDELREQIQKDCSRARGVLSS